MTPLKFRKITRNAFKIKSKRGIKSLMSVFQSDVILYIPRDGGIQMIKNSKIIHFETRK